MHSLATKMERERAYKLSFLRVDADRKVVDSLMV